MKSLLRRIRHLLSWLPIIWHDQDWDWIFLITILNRKLRNMEKFFGGEGAHLSNADNVCDRIRYARILTDRLLADDYEMAVMDRHYARWGEPIFEWLPYEEDDASVELEIRHPGIVTEQDAEMERREFRRAIESAKMSKQQDVDQLFGIMAKYIQRWWD